MQAIVCKYHGPTNVKGSRVSARCEAGSVMLHYDHALNFDQMARKAATKLCAKLGWHGNLLQGGTKEAEVFVFDDGQSFKV